MKNSFIIGVAALVAAIGTSLAGDREAKATSKADTTPSKPTLSKESRPEKAQVYTGSYIPRKTKRNGEVTDGFSQLRIIDQETIRRTGASSVAGVLNNRGAR